VAKSLFVEDFFGRCYVRGYYGRGRICESWRAPSRDPSLFCHAVGAVIAPRALAPFSRILLISPLDGVRGDPKTDCHIVVNSFIRQHIFDQHELFQEIETGDPALDLEAAAVNAGYDDGKIDDY
jgi:hypothetical protein